MDAADFTRQKRRVKRLILVLIFINLKLTYVNLHIT
jgi:hypothetical protein